MKSFFIKKKELAYFDSDDNNHQFLDSLKFQQFHQHQIRFQDAMSFINRAVILVLEEGDESGGHQEQEAPEKQKTCGGKRKQYVDLQRW